MGQPEFDAWCEFYTEHPFDDYHRYQKPAALVAWSNGGVTLQTAMDYLAPPGDDGNTEADRSLFEAAGAVPPPRKR